MKKGQLVMEFMMMLALAVIVGVLYLAITNELLMGASEHQRIAALDDLGYRVQDEAILAASVENGYERNITLPDRVDRFEYNISCDSTMLALTSGAVTRDYPLPVINGTLQKGVNTITKNGQVRVTQ
jgi:hypothetical protein